MNTIYRIVWNVTLGKWVVASELAKGRKKKSSLKTAMLSLAVVGAMAGMGVPSVYAADITMPSCIAGEDPHETGCVPTSNEQLMTPFYAVGGGDDKGNATNTAIGQGAVAGTTSTANTYATAVGSGAQATALSATAVGQDAKATGSSATAIGQSSTASGSRSFALGQTATASGDSATAMGVNARATQQYAVAIGNDSEAFAINGVAIGSGSGVAAAGASGIALGNDAQVNGVNGAALGKAAIAGGSNSVAIGTTAMANGSDSIAMGNATSASVAAIAIGLNAKAQGVSSGSGQSTAVGGNSQAVGDFSTALGSYAVSGQRDVDTGLATASATTAVGVKASALGDRSVAMGASSNASAKFGTAIGTLAAVTVDAENGTALGKSARVSASNAVALGANSIADRADSVSVGTAAATRQVVNVRAGTQDTDAVNLSQLKNTAGGVAAALGGGVTVNADGTITKPSYTVQGTPHDNVGSALGAVDTTLTSIGSRVTKNEGDIVNIDGRVTQNEGDIVDIRNQLGSGSIGLVQQDAASRDITVAAGTDGGRVNFAGTDGARKLVGVAKGEETATSTEAVNGSQLFATNERVTKNEGDIVNLDGRVTRNEGDIVTIGDRVAGAETNITNIDGRVTAAETNITNIDGRVTKNEGDIIDLGDRINNGSVGLVQQSGTNAAVTVAAATGGAVVDFTGTAGARQLKGVSTGADDTDAVNVAQLRDEIGKASAGDTRYFKADGAMDGSDDAINTGSRSVAIGAGSQATAANAVALGAGSVADRANAVSVGSKGNERQIVNVAEGKEDTDAVNVAQLKKAGLVGGDGSTLDAVVYDAGSNRGSVTFGGLGGTKLTNVMAGLVSATSTDAVNGSQLWILQDQVVKLGDRVTNVENGAPVNVPVAPSPAPGEGRDPAFAATGDGGPASATGKDSVAAGTGAKASADNSVAIGAGSVADRADTVSVGSAGAERQVSNVAAGTQRTDAANWGQVQDALATANRYTDDRFDGVNRRIGEVQRQANRGIAASAALINVTPYMPGKTVLNAGVANYRGESALGVGVSRWNDTGRVNFNAGVSAAAGDSPIFRMGVGVVLGD